MATTLLPHTDLDSIESKKNALDAEAPVVPLSLSSRPPWTERKWALVTTCMLGAGLSVSDASLIGVAMPRMLTAFSVSISTLTWVAAAYTMAMMITASMTSWLSSLVGRKHLYMYALGLFSVASILSGLAPSFEVILVTRVLQGLAAGPLAPIGSSTLLSTYSPQERASVMSLYLLGPSLGTAFGPVAGGWFIEAYSWRWVFFINVPVVLLGLFLASRVLVDSPAEQRPKTRVDFAGIALLVASLVTLQIFLLRGPREQWFSSSLIIVTCIIAVVTLSGLIWWEWRAEAPVLNLRVFRNRHYLLGFSLIFLYGMSFFSNPFILPLYLQNLRGLNAFQTGLLLLPQALVAMGLTPVVGRLYNRLGGPFLISSGMILVAGGYLDLAQLQLQTSGWRMLPGMVLTGAGLACMRAAIVPAATQSLPTSLMAVASSLIVLGRRIGGNIAYAIVATQIAQRTLSHRAFLMEGMTPSADGAADFLTTVQTHLIANGMSLSSAATSANQMLYKLVDHQSRMQAYNEMFFISGMVFVGCVPVLLCCAWRARKAMKTEPSEEKQVVHDQKMAA